MSAILIGVFACALPFVVDRVREHARLRWAVIAVLITHQVASCLQVALDGLPTMKSDPLAFHQYATEGYGRLQSQPYAQFLHVVYDTLGASHMLGCQVSNVFFSIALVALLNLLFRMGCTRIAPTLVLMYGLPLSCVFNTAVTLREPAQMAAFNVLSYLFLLLCRHGVSPATLLIFPVCALLHYLHHGLTPVLALMLPLAIAWCLKARPTVLLALGLFLFALGPFYLQEAISRLSEESSAFEQLSAGNVGYVQEYATHVGESRSSFGVQLDLSSITSLMKTGPVLFLYYLYSPLPWQVRDPLDVYGIVESLLRIALSYYAIKGVLKDSGQSRNESFLLLFMLVTLETAWAAGTANWGTAFRHRLVGWGVLVALGGKGWLLCQGGPAHSSSQARSGVLSVRDARRGLKRRRQEKIHRDPRGPAEYSR